MNKIVLEDFNEGNGYYKINLAYLNKEQVEEIETLVSKWNPTDEDIKSCIGMCLTDANEQRFKDYGTNLKECLAWLKKQGEQKSTYMVKPKFNVGDWCIDNKDGVIFQIVKVLSNTYIYKTNEGKEYSCTHYSLENDAKLWNIQDAKDGDVLMSRTPFIYGKQCPYGGLNWANNKFIKASNFIFTDSPVHPATKEQRDFLFSKMKEADYEWDANNLKVLHIEKKNIEDEKETTSENKFKEGDWIIYEDKDLREILKVTAPPDNEYICENLNGENRYLYNKDAEEYKFWTINDIKPGDVIVWKENHELTCIALIKNITYNYLKHEGKVELWFSYYTDGSWKAWNETSSFTNMSSLIAYNAKPANKERHDLLFQKMKEAGYKWDDEKKEVRKI